MKLNGPASRVRGRGALIAALAIVALGSVACVPPTGGGGGGGTPTTVVNPVKTVTNATFEWTISREADTGTFSGDVNYWSAGQSDSTEGTYHATNGNATVLKKNASGTYVAIKSEPAVSWANRAKNGNGEAVTAFNGKYLGQKVRYTGGNGWVNSSTGAAEIQWTGTFSVNFYGPLVPFWFINPKMTVNASGVGTLTATMGGFATEMGSSTRTPLPQTPNVVVATLPNVGGYNPAGFTATTAYVGATVTGVTPPQTPSGAAYWGAWPQSFVNFQVATGLGAYWYTSGNSTTDPKKPQEPISVAYNLAP